MQKSRHKPEPGEPDLTQLTDFQLLNRHAELAAKERSHPLQQTAWEIVRRYTADLAASEKPAPKDYHATLGEARWGDAKRIEKIFGIRRSVLLRLAAEGSVKSSSLQSMEDDAAAAPTRAKRLYCLVSLAEHLDRMSDDIRDS